MKKVKDRHLDIPSEANRDKHINFVAIEGDETDPADEPSTGALANEPDRKKQKDRAKDKKKRKD